MPTLKELSQVAGGEIKGPPGTRITGVASLRSATKDEIAPVESARWLEAALASKAGAFLANKSLAARLDGRPAILSPFPLAALNKVIDLLKLVPPPEPPGIHPTAIVDPEARLGPGVSVGPYAFVGKASIGARSVLMARVFVENGVEMGDDCLVEPGAVLHAGLIAGHRVRVGANAVLSRQGFGYAPSADGPVKLRHIGRVVLADDVHVGACTTIDRARFDETRIGRFTALDNLVHLGHNCLVGERSFLAAQTGMAGGSTIGDDCEVGGQVGLSNQAHLGNRCRAGAQTGVISRWKDGSTIWGCPAMPKTEFLRGVATLRRLARGEEKGPGDEAGA
ncbi:MAG TPA: UDP-3-O-(3-hydroxymyristoyl)glucosamine N-acyltransferase [Planctomycetota bacterium]|nr:UDP-3-O-(3-hydroxymyristoyl)glucosamine N-acyltransferase [Planctomycetota bacterium]